HVEQNTVGSPLFYNPQRFLAVRRGHDAETLRREFQLYQPQNARLIIDSQQQGLRTHYFVSSYVGRINPTSNPPCLRFRAHMCPDIASTRRLQSASPTPEPPTSLAVRSDR